eukprot:m.45690 g.45690  ORF g.45690 m.45690 type:complete len:148 (-) comp10284_c1_seq1:65-508(-)
MNITIFLFVLCLFQVHAQEQALQINLAKPLRPGVPFLGVGAVKHGFDYMIEDTDKGWNSTFASLSLSRVKESKLRIARTWFGPDWVMDSWGGPLNFSKPKFNQFCQWAQDMKSANVTIAIAAGWWCTGSTCSLGFVFVTLSHSSRRR